MKVIEDEKGKELCIAFPDDVVTRRFDDEKSHGLSHCMSRIDYIVEMAGEILFIEFKDPDNSFAQEKQKRKFADELQKTILTNNLKTQYRDSFLYEWASGRVNKPIKFMVLIGMKALSKAELMRRTEELEQKLPLIGPGGMPWVNSFVSECGIFNLETWNENFPKWRAERKPREE